MNNYKSHVTICKHSEKKQSVGASEGLEAVNDSEGDLSVEIKTKVVRIRCSYKNYSVTPLKHAMRCSVEEFLLNWSANRIKTFKLPYVRLHLDIRKLEL